MRARGAIEVAHGARVAKVDLHHGQSCGNFGHEVVLARDLAEGAALQAGHDDQRLRAGQRRLERTGQRRGRGQLHIGRMHGHWRDAPRGEARGQAREKLPARAVAAHRASCSSSR
ncbi:hypothetical protein D3C72_2118900 [compost metagenome]